MQLTETAQPMRAIGWDCHPIVHTAIPWRSSHPLTLGTFDDTDKRHFQSRRQSLHRPFCQTWRLEDIYGIGQTLLVQPPYQPQYIQLDKTQTLEKNSSHLHDICDNCRIRS